MKLLYVALKNDYADEKRGRSYEHNNFYDTLNRMYPGQVTYFAMDEQIAKFGRKGMNEELLKTVEREQPDIMFTVLYTNEIHPKTIQYITKQTKTITINWFCDDQWRFENFSSYWAPMYDWVVTTSQPAMEKYVAMGYDRAIKSTWAANSAVYKPNHSGNVLDVTFVGAAHSGRAEQVAEIEKRGIKVGAWGSGWPNGRISQDEMIRIFSQSRINLNFTAVSASTRNFKTIMKLFAKVFFRRGINNTYHMFPPSVIWRNLIHFRLPQPQPQIKGRNFEVPACGGLLMTEDAENLSDYYEFGKEIVVWSGYDDVVSKINYYLSHEDERKKIAQAGYERTMREHTYEKRFTEIFKKVLAGGKRK